VPARILCIPDLVDEGMVDTFEWAVALWALIAVGEGLRVHETVAADEDKHTAGVVAGLVDLADAAVDGLEWHWGNFWEVNIIKGKGSNF
jgi:hypothetical protein